MVLWHEVTLPMLPFPGMIIHTHGSVSLSRENAAKVVTVVVTDRCDDIRVECEPLHDPRAHLNDIVEQQKDLGWVS